MQKGALKFWHALNQVCLHHSVRSGNVPPRILNHIFSDRFFHIRSNMTAQYNGAKNRPMQKMFIKLAQGYKHRFVPLIGSKILSSKFGMFNAKSYDGRILTQGKYFQLPFE